MPGPFSSHSLSALWPKSAFDFAFGPPLFAATGTAGTLLETGGIMANLQTLTNAQVLALTPAWTDVTLTQPESASHPPQPKPAIAANLPTLTRTHRCAATTRRRTVPTT